MRKTAILAGLAAFSLARGALAASFDDGGNLVFDPDAIFTDGFEDSSADPQTQIVTGPRALEGGSYAVVDVQNYVDVEIQAPDGDNAVVATAFTNGAGAFVSLAVNYQDPTSVNGPFYQYVNLYPTGRMTSDGWYEVQSAPLMVQGAGQPQLRFLAQSEASTQTLVDAIEIGVVNGYQQPKLCQAHTDCDASSFCRAGICTGAGDVPPLPSADERAGLKGLFASQLRYHFGGEFTRGANLDAAIAELDAMDTATTAVGFWHGLVSAVHRLRDSHSTIYAGDFGSGSLTTCFAAGDADLTTSTPSDPTFPDVVVLFGDGLVIKPGDRLVAIDGMHPVAWERSLSGYLRGSTYATDPATYTGAIEHLNDAIVDYAHTLTVIRCDGGACGQPEDIAVAQLQQDLYDPPTCDHRPGYHLKDPTKNPDAKSHFLGDTIYSGLLADSTDDEALYGMIFDSLYQDFSQGDPYKPVLAAFKSSAKGVVIDHRTGNGGYTFFSTEVTGAFFQRTPVAADVMSQDFIWLPQPTDAATGLGLYKQNSAKGTGLGFSTGSNSPAPSLKAAFLMARDTSASDYLSLGIQGHPNTRTFGSQSDGAFSTIFDFTYGGALTYSFGSWDTVLTDGTFRLGHGAQPDEIVLPKQSDLMVGKDTAYLRALEWLRTCTDCGG